MKHLLITLAVIIASASMCMAKSPFAPIDNYEDVTHTYISPTMLRLAAQNGNKYNIGSFLFNSSDLSSIDVVTCFGTQSRKEVLKLKEQLIKQFKLEVLSDTRTGSVSSTLLGTPSKKGEYFEHLMLVCLLQNGSVTITYLTGKMPYTQIHIY